MNGVLRKTLIVGAISLPAVAQAGGLYLYEIGTTDLGFASAGTAARADDASTVYANPAGMTRLAGNQFAIGGQALYGDAKYKLDGNGALSGSNPGNVIGWLPGGSGFYSHSISDRLKVGIGFYSNFGLSDDFGSSWAGRNVVDKATLVSATLQPTVAYRLNDKWSLGVGLTANYGYVKISRQQVGTGQNLDSSDGDWKYGARVGVMFEPTSSTRVGVVYTSKVDYDFNVDATVRGVRPGRDYRFPVEASTNAPQQVMISTYQKLSDRWAMVGNIGWQDWSQFSNTTLETNNGTVNSNLKLQDTWHGALGAQYTYDAKTKINMGFAYDTSFYKHQNQASFALPVGSTWRFGAGVQYALSPTSDLGFAAEYLRADSSSSPSPLLSGKYDHPEMYFMSLTYSQRF